MESTSNASENVLKEVTSEKLQQQTQLRTHTDLTAEIKFNSGARELRTDSTLLRAVGVSENIAKILIYKCQLFIYTQLSIIKYADYEELKPIELIDTIRGKAAKFGNMLRVHGTVWNPKRFNAQCTQKIHKELLLLTEEINTQFKIKLDVSELKRILNLINAWHAHQIDLKFFKKVALSVTVDHYLQLFAFLPKINRCVYYCEWCDESSSNKSRYEKHRLTHLSRYACPHCQRGFKKQGYLFNHLRIVHGRDH